MSGSRVDPQDARREEIEQSLRENPDALLVAELSQKYPIATVPFLAELVEFVRCWESPIERDQDGVCQYCLGVGCEKCDARFLARSAVVRPTRDEIAQCIADARHRHVGTYESSRIKETDRLAADAVLALFGVAVSDSQETPNQ